MSKIKAEVVWGYNEEEELFYISNKEEWEENGCCSDTLDEDVYNVLCDLGLTEEQEGIWSSMSVLPEEIEERLDSAGFEYNEAFEDFMSNFEEE